VKKSLKNLKKISKKSLKKISKNNLEKIFESRKSLKQKILVKKSKKLNFEISEKVDI